MLRVNVRPKLLRWARRRAGRSAGEMQRRFPKYEQWERGEAAPTLKQLEAFARAVFVPVGYLFLREPPEERVPIPDMRTIGSEDLGQAGPDLLDTLYLCQRRQAWYRDYARAVGEEPRAFVGSVDTDASVIESAEAIREALEFNLEERRAFRTWEDALRRFIAQAEDIGVLVMVSGIVGNNTHRKLDPEEFRGFALSDDLAPLVFINGADTKAAQMFTLAHELAHLWLGESALTDAGPASTPKRRVERWCNAVAAELLVPLDELREVLPPTAPLVDFPAHARRFKVSTLVILRRIFDAGRISRTEFQEAYTQELERLRALPKSPGGDFYRTEEVRASRRFSHALVVNTLEGQTLYRDAFQLLAIKKQLTFAELSRRLEVAV